MLLGFLCVFVKCFLFLQYFLPYSSEELLPTFYYGSTIKWHVSSFLNCQNCLFFNFYWNLRVRLGLFLYKVLLLISASNKSAFIIKILNFHKKIQVLCFLPKYFGRWPFNTHSNDYECSSAYVCIAWMLRPYACLYVKIWKETFFKIKIYLFFYIKSFNHNE